MNKTNDISSDASKEKYMLMQEFYPVFTSKQAELYRNARLNFGLGFDKATSFFQKEITIMKIDFNKLLDFHVENEIKLEKQIAELNYQIEKLKGIK